MKHQNGRTAQAGLVVDGLQEGEWTFWYPSGAIEARGPYEQDLRTGEWSHWYENGTLRMRGSYRDQRQFGPWEFRHENGALQCRGEYRDGREHGPWEFGHASGAIAQRGLFADGHRVLRWEEFGADGKPLRTGSWLDDQQVGIWRTWDTSGKEAVLRYPLPKDREHVLESWPDGALRREGFVRDGKPDGLWVTKHRNGSVRAAVGFVAGSPTGELSCWRADGTLLARGLLADGRPAGPWLLADRTGSATRELPNEPRAPWDRQWSEAEIADQQPMMAVVHRWLDELGSPREMQAVAVAPVAPAVIPSTPTAAPESPQAPVDPGTWTVRERDELALFRRYYQDGWLPRNAQAGSRYGTAPGSPRLGQGDPVLAAAIMGKPLPVTQFPTADGRQLDLVSFRGKRVLFVVLRGFTTQVCVYCFAQTAELEPQAKTWAELECEVVVMYPGSKGKLAAFVTAFAAEFGGKPPPYHMVYDPDLTLAKALGLQGNLARPASFVLDRQGIVKHAYVAENETNIVDRPSAAELQQLVARLQ